MDYSDWFILYVGLSFIIGPVIGASIKKMRD